MGWTMPPLCPLKKEEGGGLKNLKQMWRIGIMCTLTQTHHRKKWLMFCSVKMALQNIHWFTCPSPHSAHIINSMGLWGEGVLTPPTSYPDALSLSDFLLSCYVHTQLLLHTTCTAGIRQLSRSHSLGSDVLYNICWVYCQDFISRWQQRITQGADRQISMWQHPSVKRCSKYRWLHAADVSAVLLIQQKTWNRESLFQRVLVILRIRVDWIVCFTCSPVCIKWALCVCVCVCICWRWEVASIRPPRPVQNKNVLMSFPFLILHSQNKTKCAICFLLLFTYHVNTLPDDTK